MSGKFNWVLIEHHFKKQVLVVKSLGTTLLVYSFSVGTDPILDEKLQKL